MRPLEAELRAGLAQLALPLTDGQISQLLDYQELLAKWNKVYNLTAGQDPREVLGLHLLDSLAAVGPLRRWLSANPRPDGARLLDVGSGGGLPGVVFAICCPDLLVDCLDTVAKKAAFVQQVAVSLQLPHLRGVHGRVENQPGPYSLVASRAFASLPDFVQWSRAALGEGGAWLAMKGRYPADEIAALSPLAEVFHVEQLRVPGLDAERCIVWMQHRLT